MNEPDVKQPAGVPLSQSRPARHYRVVAVQTLDAFERHFRKFGNFVR